MSRNSALLIGTAEKAQYRDPLLEDYRGNPLIEALPPISSPSQVIRYMSNLPRIREEERRLEPHLRIHCVMRLENFVHPLNRHVELEQHLSTMIRQGYVSRNPRTPNYARRLRDIALSMQNPEIAELERKVFAVPSPTSAGRSVVGVSGIGKSTAVERLIMQYPQVVHHSDPANTQVVWIKLDCPHDASLNALCLEFFEVFDQLFETNETERLARDSRMNKDKLLRRMRCTAASHSLGVLIIDEIQNLNQAKSGGKEQMLNFFVRLVNNIGVPVLLVGTPGVSKVLHATLRNGRRFGSIPGWTRLQQHEHDWEMFLQSMWRFQWTKEITPLTPQLEEVIYRETLGITDLVVKLFAISQMTAITTGKEKIDETLLSSVAKEAFYNIRPVLDALGSGSEEDLALFDDVYEPIRLQDYQTQAQERIQVYASMLPKREPESEVIDWLIQAGIPEPVAIRAAQKTECGDQKVWLRQALRAAEDMLTTTEQVDQLKRNNLEPVSKEKGIKQAKSKRGLPDPTLTPMLYAVKAGKAEKKTPYQCLLETGFIQDPTKIFLQGVTRDVKKVP